MINKIKQWLGLTYYTSKLDEFLKNFDETHPKLSFSQRQEVNKYQHVYCLRDQVQEKPKVTKKALWNHF